MTVVEDPIVAETPATTTSTLGFTINRDDHGHWHITTPDGTQIY